MADRLLAAFFSADPQEALRSLPALAGQAGDQDRSHGAVTSPDTLYSVAGDPRLRAERRGIFSEVIFGPALDDRCACGATAGEASRGVVCPRCGVLCDRSSLRDERWGHVNVTSVVHPSVHMHLFEVLGVLVEDLTEVVCGKKALRPGDRPLEPHGPKIRWEVVRADDLGDGDLTGPGGLAEALRRAAPEHPLLPLCALTKVPIPPAGERPFSPRELPTQVDPWIGPLNEAWVSLVQRAMREQRLIELSAPDVILRNESAMVQQAFEAVFRQTHRTTARLVPPLARAPEGLEDRARAMAFAGAERLIVQLPDRVSILDLQGKELFRLPPAGTQLRGVAAARYAVFEGYFHLTHPMLASTDSGFGPDFVRVDEEGVTCVERTLGEISVIDCQTGAYLDRLPRGVRLRFATNDQPEDLFLSDEEGQPLRRLRVGGDRPTAIAYAPGMGFAWVGEEGNGTEIIDLDTGIPHAYPSDPRDDDVPRWALLPIGSGSAGDENGDDEDEEDEDQLSQTAVAFHDGAWHLLWSNSILCDHRARRPARLVPPPEAAAFDPTGRTLALLVQGTIVLADVARREVIGRFALTPA